MALEAGGIGTTGSALEMMGLWSAPPWSQQPNGTVCAPMGIAEFLRLQALFAEVAALLALGGVRWLLSHGSLLGAWLHHGPIPWDEEGDLLLLPEDFHRLRSLLGPPARSRDLPTPGGSMRVHEGPPLGALRYDLHEHTDDEGGWVATAVTFRLAADPRDSPVHVDAFLARTNGSHAWTDSAVLPLESLLPARRLRFFDWLVPAPQDPKAALELWYGPRFAARRKCALKPHSPEGGREARIEQIAQIGGAAVARSYPLVRHEWSAKDIDVLQCTVHLNGTVLWTLSLDTSAGRVLEARGLARKPRLARLGAPSAAAAGVGGSRAAGPRELPPEYAPTPGVAFPAKVPNIWD